MKVKLFDLPKIMDLRGNLSFLQQGVGIPFKIERVFWTYNVPAGEKRGGHAYVSQNEVISIVSGSADIVITEKNNKETKYSLNRPDKGMFIPKGVWRHIENFSTNTVSLHLLDSHYDENDYIRDLKNLPDE